MAQPTGSGRDGSRSRDLVAYVISTVEGFVDQATVRRYAAVAGPAIARFGGRFLVSNVEPEVMEGETTPARISIVEFPSMDRARAWYGSPEYAAARALTPAAFRGRRLLFVEGLAAGEAGASEAAVRSPDPRP